MTYNIGDKVYVSWLKNANNGKLIKGEIYSIGRITSGSLHPEGITAFKIKFFDEKGLFKLVQAFEQNIINLNEIRKEKLNETFRNLK